MSNYLAVAAATATLSRTLQAAIGVVQNATVTMVRPDSPQGAAGPRVNVFLYQVTPNAARRGEDLPTRTSAGVPVRRPVAAIDLHYLLSFYGEEAQLEPQRLLGATVAALHARPVLTRQAVRDTVADNTFAMVAQADLADSAELIKLAPAPLTLEDLSRLWAVFFQTPYALSTAYVASVVFLEAAEAVRPAPPVLASETHVVPFRRPVIDSVAATADPALPILPGAAVALRGRSLRGDVTELLLGGISVAPAADRIADTQVEADLPDLPAGVHGAQVVHGIAFGDPPEPRRAAHSNVAAFVLHPVIARRADDPSAYDITLNASGGSPTPDSMTVRVTPAVASGQRAQIELMRGAAVERVVQAPAVTAPTGTLTFPLAGVPAGSYLVRVRVDGAESPFEVDGAGLPVAPEVVL